MIAAMTLTARWTGDRTSLIKSLSSPVAAAVLGNVFIGSDARCFKQLRSPARQLPLPGFMVVGGLYYASIATVLYRSAATDHQRAYRLAWRCWPATSCGT
jgi:hypothetical protein